MPDSSASYYLWAEGQEQRACHSKMAADSGVDSCHDHQPLSGICWDMVFLVFLHLPSVQHDTMGNKGYLGYLFIYSCHAQGKEEMEILFVQNTHTHTHRGGDPISL